MARFEIIPAIDLIGGKCVRLTRGDYSTRREYGADPVDMALRFQDCGAPRLHIVDLDGALAGVPRNLAVLERIAARASMVLEWGGGVKTDGSLRSVRDAGAAQIIVGSAAVKDPGLVRGWMAAYPGEIIIGADARDGKVSVSGWTEDSAVPVAELLDSYLPFGLGRTIVTDISRDGTLQGPSWDLYASLGEAFPDLEIVVSGGVASAGDIQAARARGLAGIIVGKAVYEGRITLEELQRLCLQNA